MEKRLRRVLVCAVIILSTSNIYVKGIENKLVKNYEELALCKYTNNDGSSEEFKDSLQYGRRRIPMSPIEEEECELWNKIELVKDVDCNKEWTIKFNEELNDTYYLDDILFVKNQYNRRFETYIRIKDKQTFIIIPKENYEEGITYTLYIKKNTISKSGESLKFGIKMPFKIKCDECE